MARAERRWQLEDGGGKAQKRKGRHLSAASKLGSNLHESIEEQWMEKMNTTLNLILWKWNGIDDIVQKHPDLDLIVINVMREIYGERRFLSSTSTVFLDPIFYEIK